MQYNWAHGSWTLVLLIGGTVCASAPAQPVPPGFSHQGYIEVDGEPFSGNGAFRFALVDGSGNNVWTNDGTELGNNAMPSTAVALPVEEGLYEVVLGGGAATDSFPGGIFNAHRNLSLRVWFDDGANGVQQLEPDKPLRATPHARHAAIADEALEVPSVITVDRVEYANPRVHEIMIPPTAFGTAVDGVDFLRGTLGVSTSDSGQLVAPLELPVGAVLEAVEYIFQDDDPDSDVAFFVLRLDPEEGIGSVIAEASTEGHTGVSSVRLSELGAVIQSGFAYSISALDTSEDWERVDMEVRAVKVEYSLSEAM